MIKITITFNVDEKNDIKKGCQAADVCSKNCYLNS